MEKRISEVKNLKSGSFVLIDEIPCRVDNVQISKPGKHGSAKAKLTASGVFTDHKKIIVKPADSKMDVPVIEKKNAQVVSIQDNNAQLMDMGDYNMSEAPIPDEMKEQLTEGDEVLTWNYGTYIMIKGKK